MSPPILVIGAGAIGSLVSAQCAGAGYPVTLVGRSSTTDAIRQHGLRLTESGSTTAIHAIRPVTALEEAFTHGATYRLAILAVKSYDTEQVLGQLLAATDDPPPLLTLQNGVGNEETLAAGLGPRRVLAGVITTPVSVPDPGHVIVERPVKRVGIANLATPGEPPPLLTADEAADLLKVAGFEARSYPQWQSLKWTKLVMNLLCNASCALLGWTPEQVWADRRLANLEIAAWREAILVLRRLGGHLVNFGGYPIGTLEPLLLNLPISLLRPPLGRFVIAGRGNKAPSLQIDLDRGKARSEVRWLNGAVAARAPEVGLWAPANQVLFSCLDAVIAGREPRQRYRGKPNALLDRWEQARGSG